MCVCSRRSSIDADVGFAHEIFIYFVFLPFRASLRVRSIGSYRSALWRVGQGDRYLADIWHYPKRVRDPSELVDISFQCQRPKTVSNPLVSLAHLVSRSTAFYSEGEANELDAS